MGPLLLAGIASGAQALLGGAQALSSGAKQREKELDQYAKKSPLYQGSKGIESYYKEALNRYQESPYQSAAFQQATKAAQRASAGGLRSLQDRRGAIGGVGRLAGIEGDTMGRAIGAAEANRNQRFGQLGQAAQMQQGEERFKFDVNQMTPYNRNLQLRQFKAQAANDRRAAGLQMVGGALSNFATNAMDSDGIGNNGLPKISNTANPVTVNPSGTSNLLGMPGYKAQLPSSFNKFFQTSTPKKIF
tara:strand:+ start:1022 stop:1759 length:738 start_codon:yes stop_codon:yes gene_type:complete